MQKKYVLLFPGQGSQSVGMGSDLFSEFQEMKSTFEEASDTLGFNMSRLCFEDPESKLNLTEFTQPAILTLSTAIFRTLNAHMALDFELVAGHSLGEYSALVSLGALKFSDALKSVHFRGQAMQRAVPVGVGAMAAYLGNKCENIPSICKEISTQNHVVEVVNFNSSGQLVLSGNKLAVEQACSAIAEKKLGKAKTLPVSAPFHSSLMKPAAAEMFEFLKNIPLQSFDKKIVANVDAKIHSSATYTKEILVQQIASPVLWTQTLSTIYNQNSSPPSPGLTGGSSNISMDSRFRENDNQNFESTLEYTWIEVGPGKVLKGLANKTIETANCVTTHDFAAVKELLY